MKNLQWGNGRATHKASTLPPPDKASRAARIINWRVQHERKQRRPPPHAKRICAR